MPWRAVLCYGSGSHLVGLLRMLCLLLLLLLPPAATCFLGRSASCPMPCLCSALARGISGGQAKRVNIGELRWGKRCGGPIPGVGWSLFQRGKGVVSSMGVWMGCVWRTPNSERVTGTLQLLRTCAVCVL